MVYKIILNSKDKLFYFCDNEGNLYGEWYKLANNFGSNGLAPIKDKEDNLWYFINPDFKKVSEGFFIVYAFDGNDKTIAVDVNHLWYYINNEGKKISDGYKSQNELIRSVDYVIDEEMCAK